MKDIQQVSLANEKDPEFLLDNSQSYTKDIQMWSPPPKRLEQS